MGLEQVKVELCSSWGGDRDAAVAAWASSTSKEKLASKTNEDVIRLVTGLVNLHHDTPKERIWLEYFITCPIFVERQFDKYRMTIQAQDLQVEFLHAPFGRDGISQNELSGRYQTIPDRPYGLPADVAEIMVKASDYPFLIPAQVQAQWELKLEAQHESYQQSLTFLREAEKAGRITNSEYKRVREVLRGELGTAFLTDMRIVMNMNAFEHIINQRLAGAAQLESRKVAHDMIQTLAAGLVCPHMLEEMIRVNGWQKLLDEVRAHV